VFRGLRLYVDLDIKVYHQPRLISKSFSSYFQSSLRVASVHARFLETSAAASQLVGELPEKGDEPVSSRLFTLACSRSSLD
jgi:hypothetical protein